MTFMLDKIPIIENYWFIAVITFLSFWLTMVTSKGVLSNHSFTRWFFKRYTIRGWEAIFVFVLIFITLLLQENNNSNMSNLKDRSLKTEQDNRAKKITEGISKGVKTATTDLFNNLSGAFKNQGLQYDTIKNQIITLKDSVRKSNTSPPLLRIRNLAITDSVPKIHTKTFSYEIISDDAPSHNIKLLFDVYGFDDDGYIVPIDFNKPILYKGQTIAKDQRLTGYLPLIVNFKIRTFAFRLKGYYYSSDKSKIKNR